MHRAIKLLLVCIFAMIYALPARNMDNRPYVIIVSLDGFRWDYLDRGIAPHMQALADEGVRALSFQPAFPSKTFPNHYTIVTGLYPQNHGLINNRFANPYSGAVYRLGDTSAVRNDYWYHGETLWETAGRNGMKSASFFWPGSETRLPYKHPTYFKHYDGSVSHKERVDGVISWLQLPEEQRPHLIFLYFSDTDTQGHRYGPDSQEVNDAIRLLDKQIGYLRQRLKDIGMDRIVNIIVLSDHGMTNLNPDGVINLGKILAGEQVKMDGYGPLVQIFTRNSRQTVRLYHLLQEKANGFRVFLREEVPTCWHYSANPFLGQIILVADLGNTFVKTDREMQSYMDRKPKGDHGYDNFALDMHGFFIAEGPAFRQHYRFGTMLNVDVYPLVCKILGIIGNQKIDGKLERVETLLK